jgi:hypothetical protein
VRCNSTALATALKAADPVLFPKWNPVATAKLCFTPNDWSTVPGASDYLDYIGAREAWNITKGDPSVILGNTDNYIYDTHPDFYNADGTSKIKDEVNSATPTAPYDSSAPYHHGTATSSIMVAATHNGKGIPSVGFNCRLDFSCRMVNSGILALSRRGRRIINASWYSSATPTLNLRDHFDEQETLNEIYENGTLTFVAASNGWEKGYSPTVFTFPASLDHVFCTTSIGWQNDAPATFNVKGLHDWSGKGPDSSYNYNSRVDISAPTIVGACKYVPWDPSTLYYTYSSGTSASSPITAAVAGLVQSALKQSMGDTSLNYSPYQLEWILKWSANPDILSLPGNAPYAGGLGVGRLDALKAVQKAAGDAHAIPTAIDALDVNDPTTQTMYIQGISINMICAPGHSSNGALPKLTPIIVNGVPPYQYVWEAYPDNNATLDNENIAAPTVVASTGKNYLHYRLTVYDNSKLNPTDATPTVQKVAMKTFRIQLTTAAKSDLAMQDSYMDMLNEPNTQRLFDGGRDWNTWDSPDLWNRQLNDGSTEHQNPEYFISAPNYANVRIRNIGCSTTSIGGGNSYLHLYWTKSSAGEDWADDWTIASECGIGKMMPTGREITTGTGIILPVIQPGEERIITQAWYPPKPQDYCGTPASFDACLLARIQQHLYLDSLGNYHYVGMTINELAETDAGYSGVGVNIRNNNNIVTRNMVLTNLNLFDKRTDTRQLVIANGNNVTSVFNFDFGSDRSIFLHFAGDFSSLGHVTLHLGDLYDRWVGAGSQGTVASSDAVNKTVTFNGAKTLQLNGLSLAPDEHFNIGVEFALDSSAVIHDTSKHVFFARQFDQANPNEVYGAVNYRVTVSPSSQNTYRLSQNENTINKNSSYKLSPNPTSDFVAVSYTGSDTNPVDIVVTDMSGKKVWTEQYQFGAGTAHNINLSRFPTGVYLINITNTAGKTEVYKVVKE